MPLWHKNYFELKATEKKEIQEKFPASFYLPNSRTNICKRAPFSSLSGKPEINKIKHTHTHTHTHTNSLSHLLLFHSPLLPHPNQIQCPIKLGEFKDISLTCHFQSDILSLSSFNFQ